MREDYDLKTLKVKRRGMLPGLEERDARAAKVRVTIALDLDVVEHFKAEAKRPGALPYQTQINQALRRAAFDDTADVAIVKAALLHDRDFLKAVAEAVERRHHT